MREVIRPLGYVSNTEREREEMLATIGVSTFQDLLAPIPEAIRLKRDLNIPPTLDEAALVRHLQQLSSQNVDCENNLCFIGAGIYDHFRPSVVGALASRGEFATSYTPYQPELSQGMLQAVYEYQTLICALTGMDISNASMYDAATGMAEAALMCADISGRKEVVASQSIHPHYRQVVQTYLQATGYQLVEVPYTGTPEDLDTLKGAISDKTACVLSQQPNFFGCLEDLTEIVSATHETGAFSVVSVDPISLGMLRPPADFDVDIVVGEGQSLGNAMGFGGPLLGFFACKKKFVRNFPGRIVGATIDQQGRRGYTMTLRTREQDIRRERATSNICTNEALLALCATIYLCELGKDGLRQVADLCLQKAHYAQQELCSLPGVELCFPQTSFFKEFAVSLPVSPEKANKQLLQSHILGGLPLADFYAGMKNAQLICVTETKTRADIDCFVNAVSEAIQ